MYILPGLYNFANPAHTDSYHQYGRFFMRSFLYAILSITLIVDMSLLGMLIARLESEPEAWHIMLDNLNKIFEFL